MEETTLDVDIKKAQLDHIKMVIEVLSNASEALDNMTYIADQDFKRSKKDRDRNAWMFFVGSMISSDTFAVHKVTELADDFVKELNYRFKDK